MTILYATQQDFRVIGFAFEFIRTGIKINPPFTPSSQKIIKGGEHRGVHIYQQTYNSSVAQQGYTSLDLTQQKLRNLTTQMQHRFNSTAVNTSSSKSATQTLLNRGLTSDNTYTTQI